MDLAPSQSGQRGALIPRVEFEIEEILKMIGFSISVKQARTVDRPNAHTVTIKDSLLNTEETKTAWTNKRGFGLWVDGQQVLGTGQFIFKPGAIRSYFQRQYNT